MRRFPPFKERGPWAAAFLAASGFALYLFFLRLPAAADFVVPRHPGFALFRAALAWGRYGKAALVLAAPLLILAAGAVLLWDVAKALDWGRDRERLGSPAAWLWLALGGPGLLIGARCAVSLWSDLLLNVWFAPGAADLREPAMAFLAVFWAVFFLGGSLRALACWAARRERACLLGLAASAGALLVPALLVHAWAAAGCDIRARSLARAAGLPREPLGREAFIILGARAGRPDFEVQVVPTGRPGLADLSEPSLQGLERYLAAKPLSVFRRQAKRLLAQGYARLQDVPRLRQCLWAAARGGDELAWVLLVEHLSCAPPDALAARLLESLADERRWRVGPRAAGMLAAAYAHLGLSDEASAWARRSAEGLGLAAALASAPAPGGALRPGAVMGRVRGLGPARVALYCRRDPGEPYDLAAGRLAASGRTDEAGRFAFAGLAAGDYFLALSIPAGRFRPEEVVVRGHRGDISLSARTPSARVELDITGGAVP